MVAHNVSSSIALVADVGEGACHEIEPLLVEALRSDTTSVFVARYATRLYVVVMRKGALQMANRYEARTDEDVLYHVLNVYEQFGLDVRTVPLMVYDGVSTDLLSKYF